MFYGWWIVFACFLISFYVAGVTFYGFTAFIEPLVQEFGWSYTQVSFAASLRGMEMGILAPCVGFLVDRVGCRRLLVAGVFFLGCGVILLGFAQSLAMFYGAFLLISFGAGGCTSVVTMTAVANWFDKNIGKALGVMASGFGASGLFVPVIVWLIAAYGWRTAAIVLGLGVWVFGIPLAFVVRNSPEEYGLAPDGRAADEPTSSAEVERLATEIGFGAAIRNRSFLYFILVEIIRIMSLASVVTHIMPYLSSVGVSRTTSGVLAGAIPLLSIVGRFTLGWMGDLVEKRRVMTISYALMAIGLLAFCYANVSGMIYLFLFFFSIGFGGLSVLRGAVLREYYGRHSFGKLMGVMMGFAALGGIIGPTLAGWIFDTRGNYYFVWLFLFGLIVLAVFLMSLVGPKSEVSRPAV
jgi:MFS family permease